MNCRLRVQPDLGFYLKGDSRTITNQSGSSVSQLCIQNGADYHEIQLCYRPSLTYSVGGLENGRVVNNIRIYVVNLNSSDSISVHGELPLQISCINTLLISKITSLSSNQLTVTSVLDGAIGSVSIPISCSSQGAVIHVETVVSNVSIQRWIR